MKYSFRKSVVLPFLFVITTGCASYSQVYVGPNGDVKRCAAWGRGLVGISQAKAIQRDCCADMRAAGYIEIERAGVIGIIVDPQHKENEQGIKIIKIQNNSPAQEAGIKVGDIVVSVDGQNVNSVTEAAALFFGEAGKPVSITIVQDGKKIDYNLIRASRLKVFGIPQSSEKKDWD